MSILDKPSSSQQALPPSKLTALPPRDIDPLLKDLNEKKQSFRKNVLSLAAELKEVRSRLSLQEQWYAKETLIRQEAEIKAKNMEEEIERLQKRLEERNQQLQASASNADKYLKELNDLRSQLATTQATADASGTSAQSALLQCYALLKELEYLNITLQEQDGHVSKLGQQLDDMQKDLQARDSSQKQLKDEVLRIEHDIMQALANAGARKECELRKLLDDASPKNLEKINKLLNVKDEEIAKLKYEIKIIYTHWQDKIKELESQLEKQHFADQELKKKVMKLEFCLQEARTQTRKLQRMEDRRDKAIKQLKNQLAAKQNIGTADSEKQKFWETAGFKAVISMSVLILVAFAKR